MHGGCGSATGVIGTCDVNLDARRAVDEITVFIGYATTGEDEAST
jgi:hypothetical protein